MVESQYIMLPIIDRLWVDHLYIMDALKTGIGLRGYGQKDPRVEYEKEAYEIFDDLKNTIADEAIKAVFSVRVEQAPVDENGVPIEPGMNRSRPRRAAVPAGDGYATPQFAPLRPARSPRSRRPSPPQQPAAPRMDAATAERLLGPGAAVPADPGPHQPRRGRAAQAGPERRRREGRPQRPLPLRQRQEVQALPRQRHGGLKARPDDPAQRAKLARVRAENRRTSRAAGARGSRRSVVGTIVVTLGTVLPEALDRGLGLHLPYAVRASCTGIATMIVIYALGEVSGAHTNPIVTSRRSRCGATSTGRACRSTSRPSSPARSRPGRSCWRSCTPPSSLRGTLALGPWPAFWLEIVLTAILVLVAISTANMLASSARRARSPTARRRSSTASSATTSRPAR